MQKPPALRPGDRVAIVAPASAFKREEFDRGLAEIRRLGFEPVYDDAVFERKRYLAGSAETRARALRAAWCDPTVAAIIGVRGGYGSAQVLPLLDVGEIVRNPKPFIGYSDLTALLTFLTVQCRTVAFHGPMLAGRLSRGADGYDEATFLHALTRAEPMGAIRTPGLDTIRPGEATGPLYGGTITQLLASFGTPFTFDPPQGCILFLEEVSERPYRLDRMLTQLAQSGTLNKAAGIVVGELPGCDEPGGEPTARAVIADLLSEFHGPVIVGLPSGHAIGPALTLPLGVRCRVIAGDEAALIVEESAVV